MAEEEKLLLTGPEAASLLNIGKSTIYSMAARGEIACLRLGRTVRFRRCDLDAFIAANAKAEPLASEPVDATSDATMYPSLASR